MKYTCESIFSSGWVNLCYMVHDFVFFWRRKKTHSVWSACCWIRVEYGLIFLCVWVYKFCHNCDFKSQTPHENGAREKTIQRKHQFNYTFILVTFTVFKYTYTSAHVQSQQKKSFYFTNLQQFVQEISPANLPRRWTNKQTHMTFGKNFSWPFERNATLYSTSSNRLNKVSHQVEQFANGVILTVFI